MLRLLYEGNDDMVINLNINLKNFLLWVGLAAILMVFISFFSLASTPGSGAGMVAMGIML